MGGREAVLFPFGGRGPAVGQEGERCSSAVAVGRMPEVPI